MGFKNGKSEKSQETTANRLYNHLFEACNILRGPIDQDDYKSYVIPILFFKRISDVYDEEVIANQQTYGEDISLFPEEEIRFMGLRWRHTLIERMTLNNTAHCTE